jgi:hypothetical protein
MKTELMELNEAIDTIKVTLDAFGEDEQLSEQLHKLLQEREELIKKIQSLN